MFVEWEKMKALFQSEAAMISESEKDSVVKCEAIGIGRLEGDMSHFEKNGVGDDLDR